MRELFKAPVAQDDFILINGIKQQILSSPRLFWLGVTEQSSKV